MCSEKGADVNKFHLIGHSLGAHTVKKNIFIQQTQTHTERKRKIVAKVARIFVMLVILTFIHFYKQVGYAGMYTKSGKIPRITGTV